MAENATNRGPYKKGTFALYYQWRCIPESFKGKNHLDLLEMGIVDPVLMDLLECRLQSHFGEKYNVSENTMTSWNKRIDKMGMLGGFNEFGKKLSHNVMGALYRNAVASGDAREVESWMALVEGIERKKVIENSGNLEITDTRANADSINSKLEELLDRAGQDRQE